MLSYESYEINKLSYDSYDIVSLIFHDEMTISHHLFSMIPSLL